MHVPRWLLCQVPVFASWSRVVLLLDLAILRQAGPELPILEVLSLQERGRGAC